MNKRIRKVCPRALMRRMQKAKQLVKTIRYRQDMILNPDKNKLFCPCCGMKFRSFVPWDYQAVSDLLDTERYQHIRQDILCPYCHSLPRHRILASWGEQHQQLFQDRKILYFAIEQGMKLWMERHRILYTSADLSRESDLNIDIQETGLYDESYDIVICNHVLEHVDNFNKALKEVHRILRIGGSFICSFPMDPKVELIYEDLTIHTKEEYIRHYGQHNHRRVFGMKAGQLLQEEGFVVETIRGEDYPEEILPVIGPADYDMNILFHCVKTGKR